jgi:hypothetical protein
LANHFARANQRQHVINPDCRLPATLKKGLVYVSIDGLNEGDLGP